ncbi:hypothetical protein [Porphyromonas macacae]|uniref:Uncharacterized protein n=1 Tax=Porphyromonas macacae TaxID=28115 RepID=A0A379DK00_9PORP|nr:hypothetical protein [Porphyromonas macacae]SUB78709.1 Uncharacterised protein [Porphyromonas macacae]
MLTSFFSYANTNDLAGGIVASPIVIQKTIYTVDLGDITNISKEEVANAINDFISQIPSSELDCSVTVKAEINGIVVKGSIEVTVSGPCSEVRKKGREIAEQVIAEIKENLL